MIQAPDLPLWAALVTSALVLAGAAITLLGAFGLLRLKTFYERAHAPTLGTTAGMTLTLLASIVGLSVLQGRPVLHAVLIALFVTVTAPVTLTLLVRAAVFRDADSPIDANAGSARAENTGVENTGPESASVENTEAENTGVSHSGVSHTGPSNTGPSNTEAKTTGTTAAPASDGADSTS